MGLLGLLGVLKRAHAKDISAAIAGVKLGDRVLIAGTDDVRLAAALAETAGLTGRAVVIAADAETAGARAASIEALGALAEPAHAPLTMLPLDSGTFDLVVADHTLLALPDQDRAGALGEFFRVLRPGGRLLWIERQPRGGLLGAAQPSHAAADNSARERALSAAGFRGARTLAAAEGRTYVEGIKANS